MNNYLSHPGIPGVTYVFVPVRTPSPATDSCSRDNFWTTFFMKQKANISIELQVSNVTNGCDLDHDLDLWMLKVKCDLDLWPYTHDLDHGFSWSNFEIVVSKNGRADWHCTKGVAVGHLWPWPWPFGDQGQVYGSTRQWPDWLQLSACGWLI